MLTQKKVSHRLTATLALVFVLIASQATQVALAALPLCRSDPIILLSNGTLMDVSADVSALLFEIREVRYEVHVPAGLRAIAVISTPGWPTTIERFAIYDDNLPGHYDSTTTVRTWRSGTAVTANMLVNLRFDSTSGVSGDALQVSIVQP